MSLTTDSPLARITYSDSIDTDSGPECAFAADMCLAWAAWQYGAGKHGARGTFSEMTATSELKGHKDFTDAQLMRVDRAIAQIPSRMSRLIRVHYCTSEDDPMTLRYRKLGCTRIEYRTRLNAAHAALYARLMPDVEQWRQLVL